MQAEMGSFSSTCDKFGLIISTKRTEVLFQSAPGNQYHGETFTYLRSTLSRNANIDAEINNRNPNAISAFAIGKLRVNF